MAGLHTDHARPQEDCIRPGWITSELGGSGSNRNDMSSHNLLWRGMIRLRPIADDDPVLNQSRLLKAMELTFAYADTNGGIGLTQTKALNRKFVQFNSAVAFRLGLSQVHLKQ